MISARDSLSDAESYDPDPKQVAAPKKPGSRKFPVIEPAPGRYVKEKAA